MGSIFGLIFALAKALPIVDRWITLFMEGYTVMKMNQQKNAQEVFIGSLRVAFKKAQDASVITDDDQRLKEKADAACEIEKLLNPNSDC